MLYVAILIVGVSRNKHQQHAAPNQAPPFGSLSKESQARPKNESEASPPWNELAVLRTMCEDLQRENAKLKEGIDAIKP